MKAERTSIGVDALLLAYPLILREYFRVQRISDPMQSGGRLYPEPMKLEWRRKADALRSAEAELVESISNHFESRRAESDEDEYGPDYTDSWGDCHFLTGHKGLL